MSHRRIATLQVGLLLVSVCAAAAVRSTTIRITILDSETHSVSMDSSGVPKNCDGVNYDAYCLNSKTVEVTNTLLVQEGKQPPFRVTCTIDTKWSRCLPLPKGSSFDAKREKRGLMVYYADDNGKLRKQLYAYAAEDEKSHPAAPAAAAANQASPASAENAGKAAVATAPAAAGETVKISFTSTPAGAEVTVDGKYVGSTPSTLGLSVGTHVVEVSLPGFTQWKREMTVSPGSELTVNAVLEKAQ